MNYPLKHQPRWRITEEMAAELAHARREAGFKSWEDFFRSLLHCRWKARAEAKPPEQTPDIQDQLKSIRERMGWFETNQKLHLALAESHEEALQAGQQEQKEILEAVRRVVNLLNQAMNEQTKRPPSPMDKFYKRLPV